MGGLTSCRGEDAPVLIQIAIAPQVLSSPFTIARFYLNGGLLYPLSKSAIASYDIFVLLTFVRQQLADSHADRSVTVSREKSQHTSNKKQTCQLKWNVLRFFLLHGQMSASPLYSYDLRNP